MNYSSEHIFKIKPYKLASHKIWECKEIEDFLKLDWNEATIEPSPYVTSAITDFLKSNRINLYPDVCNKDLLDNLSKYAEVPVENVQYFASSDSAHEYISKVAINFGESVLVVAPTYDNFRIACESIGATVIPYYLNSNFDFDIYEFENSIEELAPKVVYICNPNNPTGTAYSQEIIKGLVERHKNSLFIIDEAYYEFHGESSAKLTVDHKNIVVTRTFSKAFALANLRIGYIVANADFIHEINKIRNPKNISSISQVSALAALSDVDYMRAYVNEVMNTKVTFCKKIQELLGVQAANLGAGGNFQIVHFQDELSKNYFSGGLARKNIFIRDLSHIPTLETSVRITIGTGPQMDRVTNELAKLYA